jgi:hypothetical protein
VLMKLSAQKQHINRINFICIYKCFANLYKIAKHMKFKNGVERKYIPVEMK